MPEDLCTLQQVQDHLASVHANDTLKVERLHKNQEVTTFGGIQLIGPGPHDEAYLKSHKVRLFQDTLVATDLTLTSNIDAHSSHKHQRNALLQMMLEDNHEEIAIAMLDLGADPLECDADKNTAIHLAIKYRRRHFLQVILQMIERNKPQPRRNETPAQTTEKSSTAIELSTTVLPLPESQIPTVINDANTPTTVTPAAVPEDNLPSPTIAEPPRRNPKAHDIKHRKKLHESDLNLTNSAGESILSLLEDKQALNTKKTAPSSNLDKFITLLAKMPLNHAHIVGDGENKAENNALSAERQRKHQHAITQYNLLKTRLKDEKATPQTRHRVFGFFKPVSDDVLLGKSTANSYFLPYDLPEIRTALAIIDEYARFTWKHLGRRYRADATTLLEPYTSGKKHISTVQDVLDLYTTLYDENCRVESLPHDKLHTNNVYNSSYCRRLNYALEELRKTAIIKNYRDNDFRFDIEKYEAFLLINHHPIQPVFAKK